MRDNVITGKLLIIVTNEQDTLFALEAIKKGGATGGTRTTGRGVAAYSIPGGLPEATAREGLIFSVVRRNKESVLDSLIQCTLSAPQDMGGMALLVNVSGLMLSSNRQMEELSANNMGTNMESDTVQSGATLITGIINHGQADDIMAVARKAGAQGGTIINARGTGTEEDVSFFGISLAPEKEMLLIVADNKHCAPILDAICALPVFAEPGGGIVYTVPLEQFIVLGRSGLNI